MKTLTNVGSDFIIPEPLTDVEIFKVLRKIVMQVTGVPECILADTSIDAPKTAYASIRPRASTIERGQANIYQIVRDGTITTIVKSQQVISNDVTFFRGTAKYYAAKIKEAAKLPSVRNLLTLNKMGWAGTTNVQNLTAFQTDKVEERATISINIYIENIISDGFNNIQQFDVNIFDSESGEKVVSTTVTSSV